MTFFRYLVLTLTLVSGHAWADPQAPFLPNAPVKLTEYSLHPALPGKHPLGGERIKGEATNAYSPQIFWDNASAVKWEAAAVFGGATVLGITSWKWGSEKSFKFNSEGWFDKDTGSGGADKLGHAFSSYAITNFLTERLVMQNKAPAEAALTAAILTQGIMLYVEVFDGYSGDHGFSGHDLAMNVIGSALAYARQTHPRLRDLVDFRMEYEPSGQKGFRPLSDYEGQKYLLALKFSGIDALRDTPLRYLELQGGYYTRGFKGNHPYTDRDRSGFVGVGVNLSELFFGRRKSDDSGMTRLGRGFFEHVQVPYTAVRHTW